MEQKTLILAGLGPYARKVYYPFLESRAREYGIQIALILELEDQEEKIREFLSSRELKPKRVIFLKPEARHGDQLDEIAAAELGRALAAQEISGIMISTEPKAHKPYIQWALANNIDVLLDKPITSPPTSSTDAAAALRVYEDYLEIEGALEKSSSNLIVLCQRRYHRGFLLVKKYLDEFVERYEVPISYTDLYHADGSWYMPSEIFEREGHPYKYGYGKLMHSGYHFINLLDWMLEANIRIASRRADRAELYVRSVRPHDFLHQVGAPSYERFFGTNRFEPFFEPESRARAKEFGEMDAFLFFQFKQGAATLTSSSIHLLSNSFSRRAWSDLPIDTYKGNGRLPHERINVQVGPLLNIQVHEYKAYETQRRDVETRGAGNGSHFDIYIFRNSGLIGGTPLEKINMGEAWEETTGGLALNLQEEARERCFLDFLEGKRGNSHFADHKRTARLLSKACECLARESRGELPFLAFDI